MTLGIVTVTYNSAGVLDDFIQCLLEQTCSDWVLYAIDNPAHWRDYGATVWGFTAVDGPHDTTVVIDGTTRQFHTYTARGVAADYVMDDGTLAATAPGGSVPFAPEIAVPALVAIREKYGLDKWIFEGKLDQKYDAIDALVAGFPAGTVSGAPKVRAMEIIDELEKEKRGVYAGCVGYFSCDGDMDTCIVLRTAIVKDGKMYVQAGAGVVADSIPENEHVECVNKAKALFRAAEDAVRFAGRAGRGQ